MELSHGKLTELTMNLAREMKADNFTFSDEVYRDAAQVFIDEQVDSDYDELPSNEMLAIWFFTQCLAKQEMDVEDIIERPFPLIILPGDTRAYYTRPAPHNDHGFVAVLYSPEHEPVAPMTAEDKARFHAHNTELNGRLATKCS